MGPLISTSAVGEMILYRVKIIMCDAFVVLRMCFFSSSEWGEMKETHLVCISRMGLNR